jgi:hypothetical protein
MKVGVISPGSGVGCLVGVLLTVAEGEGVGELVSIAVGLAVGPMKGVTQELSIKDKNNNIASRGREGFIKSNCTLSYAKAKVAPQKGGRATLYKVERNNPACQRGWFEFPIQNRCLLVW